MNWTALRALRELIEQLLPKSYGSRGSLELDFVTSSPSSALSDASDPSQNFLGYTFKRYKESSAFDSPDVAQLPLSQGRPTAEIAGWQATSVVKTTADGVPKLK